MLSAGKDESGQTGPVLVAGTARTLEEKDKHLVLSKVNKQDSRDGRPKIGSIALQDT